MVSWGILGWGWVARAHVAPALGDALVAVCDNEDDLHDFLATPAVEHVYVATPNACHEEHVRAAAAAGCHVLCEKPTALSLTSAQRMANACAAAGVRFATAFNQRFHPAHTMLRRLVADGVLGTVTQARVHYACSLPPWWSDGDWHFDPLTAGGGAVFDLAPHGIDLIGVLLDALPQDVVALHQRRILPHPIEDGGVVTVRFDDGALGVVQVAYTCPETLPRRTLELVGTEGMAIARDTMGQTPGGTLELIGAADGVRRPVAFDVECDPFSAQLRAFSTGAWPWPITRDLAVMGALEAATGLRAAAV
jgi:1,5-anhydro-D-fructose reductase (1,5-anhydro-D-mannitol-forming)